MAKGLELSWKSWTNIGVLIAFLQEVMFSLNFKNLQKNSKIYRKILKFTEKF